MEIDGWIMLDDDRHENLTAYKKEGDDLAEIFQNDDKYTAMINHIFYAEYERFSEAMEIADRWLNAL